MKLFTKFLFLLILPISFLLFSCGSTPKVEEKEIQAPEEVIVQEEPEEIFDDSDDVILIDEVVVDESEEEYLRSINNLQAEEVVVPTTNRVNLEPININYNDTKAIANVSKTILKDKVNLLSEVSLIKKETSKATYELEDYIVTVHYDKNDGLGVKDVKLTIETKFTNNRKDELKLVTSNDATQFVDGTVNEYNVKIKVNDKVAPVIKLKKSSVTIKESDDFDIKEVLLWQHLYQ